MGSPDPGVVNVFDFVDFVDLAGARHGGIGTGHRAGHSTSGSNNTRNRRREGKTAGGRDSTYASVI